VICGRGKTCDAVETDSRNNRRMPFGADLMGGNSTVIPFQDNHKLAIGRTNISLAHFDEGNNRRKTILDSKTRTEKSSVRGLLLMPLSAVANDTGHRRALTWVK